MDPLPKIEGKTGWICWCGIVVAGSFLLLKSAREFPLLESRFSLIALATSFLPFYLLSTKLCTQCDNTFCGLIYFLQLGAFLSLSWLLACTFNWNGCGSQNHQALFCRIPISTACNNNHWHSRTHAQNYSLFIRWWRSSLALELNSTHVLLCIWWYHTRQFYYLPLSLVLCSVQKVGTSLSSPLRYLLGESVCLLTRRRLWLCESVETAHKVRPDDKTRRWCGFCK